MKMQRSIGDNDERENVYSSSRKRRAVYTLNRVVPPDSGPLQDGSGVPPFYY